MATDKEKITMEAAAKTFVNATMWLQFVALTKAGVRRDLISRILTDDRIESVYEEMITLLVDKTNEVVEDMASEN